MKKYNVFKKLQKIIISLFLVIFINFTIPIRSEAGFFHWTGNTIGQPLMQLLCMVGDAGIGILHRFVLNVGSDQSVAGQVVNLTDSVLLDADNPTVTNGDLYSSESADSSNTFKLEDFDSEILGLIGGSDGDSGLSGEINR